MAKYPGQIRIGNRQDEPIVRPLIAHILAKNPEELDLNGADKDLRNIEQAYFGNGGLFLIAERDGVVVGLLGAKEAESPECLRIDRFYIFDQSEAGEQTAKDLLRVLDNFAVVSDYNKLILPAYLPDAHKLACLGNFSREQANDFYEKEFALPCFGSLELRLKGQEAVARAYGKDVAH